MTDGADRVMLKQVQDDDFSLAPSPYTFQNPKTAQIANAALTIC